LVGKEKKIKEKKYKKKRKKKKRKLALRKKSVFPIHRFLTFHRIHKTAKTTFKTQVLVKKGVEQGYKIKNKAIFKAAARFYALNLYQHSHHRQ